jgi:glc operon protein GlcG
VVDITLQLTQALLAYATDQARQEFNRPVCVALCDSRGFLTGFFRMDGAPVRSIQLSQQKAYTCTRMSVTTEAFLARLRHDDIPIGYFCDPLLTALPGGAVLTNAQGIMTGGVGISGLAPSEDQTLADRIARFGAQYASPEPGR